MFNYRWTFSDYPKEKNGFKVFSTFTCGGGSTMGYKLAGYEVLGCEDIDPQMINVYKENHHPKYAFLEGIKDFKNRTDLPEELYHLDILDGSPPCSTFSQAAGNRENSWGKEKVFREGQALQVLDTLFFDFIELAKKLQPKIIIAENVKGIILGNAIQYAQRIIKEFELAGYWTEYFLLNGSFMGLPQARERVFFISVRKDIANKIPGRKINLFSQMPYLDLNFNEPKIPFKEIKSSEFKIANMETKAYKTWLQRSETDTTLGDTYERIGLKKTAYSISYLHDLKVCPTITASCEHLRFNEYAKITSKECILASSFPQDYNFLKVNTIYLCGMSVPPVMMAQIAKRIAEQWLFKACA